MRTRIDAESVPVVGRAYRFGVNPFTTTIVLLGPVVIALVAIVGRTPWTVGLGAAYVAAAVASVLYFWITGREPEEGDPGEGTDGRENEARDDTGAEGRDGDGCEEREAEESDPGDARDGQDEA